MKVTERTLTLKTTSTTLPSSEISVFEAKPSGAIRGGIILVQEIFGVNAHIKRQAKHYAKLGYVVWAPAYFDHFEKGIELGYDESAIAKGRDLVGQLGFDQAISDTREAAKTLRRELPEGHKRVAVIGFCWGGSIAWLASTRLKDDVKAAVSYYGRQAHEFRSETPAAPLIMHFGEKDPSISMSMVDDIKKSHPTIPVYVYENASHAFNRDEGQAHDPKAAKLAETRTIEFLHGLGM